MPESSRDMQMPRYSRCRDIVGSEYNLFCGFFFSIISGEEDQ